MQYFALGMLISKLLNFNLEMADIPFGEQDHLVLHGLKLYTYSYYGLEKPIMQKHRKLTS